MNIIWVLSLEDSLVSIDVYLLKNQQIRIRIGLALLNPDPGAMKLAKFINKPDPPFLNSSLAYLHRFVIQP